MEERFEEIWSKLGNAFVDLGPRLLSGIVLALVGWYAITFLLRFLRAILIRRDVDATLRPFLIALLNIILKIMLFISVAGMVGIETTSFVAALGALGLAVGLALQGSLSNFAGGVLILLFKPFKVGDYIESQTNQGTVRRIDLLYTLLLTPDNKIISIPNGILSNNAVINHTAEPTRRVELSVSVAYETDLTLLEKTLRGLAFDTDYVHNEPEPIIGIAKFGESAIDVQFWFWVDTEGVLMARRDMQSRIRTAFERNRISIPLPQREIRVVANAPGNAFAS